MKQQHVVSMPRGRKMFVMAQGWFSLMTGPILCVSPLALPLALPLN